MNAFIKKYIPSRWHYRISQYKKQFFGYTTYSQFGEDQVLLLLCKDIDRGRYVDVGAFDPYRYSNTFLLYKRGWSGVNIDPNPEAIKRFKKKRPHDQNICSGVGNEGILTYYQFSDPAVNTFVAAEAEKWMNKTFLTFLGTTEIPVRPLSQLISGVIDVLTIDTEGMDLQVLESYDWKEIPKIIVIEGNNSEPFLRSKGYVLYAKKGISFIYLHKKYSVSNSETQELE